MGYKQSMCKIPQRVKYLISRYNWGVGNVLALSIVCIGKPNQTTGAYTTVTCACSS